MSLVKIINLSYSVFDKQLYNNANLVINKGEHIGLVGINGSGKTTLLNIINQQISPDKGNIEIHPKVVIGYLDQHQNISKDITVREYLQSVYQELYNIEIEINNLYQKITDNYEEKLLIKAIKLQEDLDHSDFDLIAKKINNLIVGLGINTNLLDKKLFEISGGQLEKIILAKLLLSKVDLLLLDEPNNFLDIEQVKWLANFLDNYEGTFLLISHDRDFLNQTTKIIYDINNYQLIRYVGNFDSFLMQRQLKNDQYLQEYQSQQQLIKKLETYIAKNAARSSTSASARSRKKQLKKLDIITPPKNELIPNFNFRYKKPSATIVLKAENLSIGYTDPLIAPLTFAIREGEKCIVKGFNGIGKSTFLKTVAKKITSLSGSLIIGQNVIINFFEQMIEIPNITSIEYLWNLFPDLDEKTIRGTLANFAIKNSLVIKSLTQLSGGEQTKVRLAGLSLSPCSLLLLDEPTNHLDIQAKNSLVEAIQNFPGTVLLTTHDINFNTSWAHQVLDFEKKLKKK